MKRTFFYLMLAVMALSFAAYAKDAKPKHKGIIRTVANLTPKQVVVTSAKVVSYPVRHPVKFAKKTKAIAY